MSIFLIIILGIVQNAYGMFIKIVALDTDWISVLLLLYIGEKGEKGRRWRRYMIAWYPHNVDQVLSYYSLFHKALMV